MAKRVPASMRTRESLSNLMEGRLSSADGRAALVKLATRLIVEEVLEAESRDALDRGYYEHGASASQGLRDGVRTGRLKTAQGIQDYAAPQIAGRDEPFRSKNRETLKGRTQALEDQALELLASGQSMRDIEDAFRDESGWLLLSRTAVSEIGERLWADYKEFAGCDPSKYDIAYLFVDGIAERIRLGQGRDPVLAAGGFTMGGARVLLHLMAGSKKNAETMGAFVQDMRARPRRSPAGGLGRGYGHHQGGRDLFSALGASTSPRPSHEEPRGQGVGRPLARVQDPRHDSLPSPVPRHRP